MDNGHKPIGVLAIQGDFAMHAQMLDRIAAPWKLVKHAAELEGVSGLIMPGGESTTMLKFFANEDMGAAIRDFAAKGKPVFGTCAGAILLAKEVLNPSQERLGLLDITIERNAYGRQVDSSVRLGECPNSRPARWRWSLSGRRSSAGWGKGCGCWGAAMACRCWSSSTTSLPQPSIRN